ncbi:MAG TPA: ester cyclase [Streptosporangiaceae bacterium]|nr:ester cyclase [Streptosporangiaceae bacterium]
MKKWQRATLITALAAATAGGVTFTGVTANAGPAASSPGHESVAANIRVVETFLHDVLDGHHGDHAANNLTADAQFHAGTVGDFTGRATVAGVLGGVVAAIPDLHANVQDIFGHGDEVVVRLVVTGTQQGPLLGIPATGRHLEWDAIDLYRLRDGKISQEWASEDLTAILNDTGTYKAPWIP